MEIWVFFFVVGWLVDLVWVFFCLSVSFFFKVQISLNWFYLFHGL